MASWGEGIAYLQNKVLREKERTLNLERLGEGGRVIVSQVLTFTLLSFPPSYSFLLIINFSLLVPSSRQ